MRISLKNRPYSALAVAVALTLAMGSSALADVRWSTDIEQSLQAAAQARKPVLMEFTAPWCVYCKRMEKTTFADPVVADRINQHFVAIQVDADRHKDLVKQLQVRGLPAILIVSPDLTIIERISGYQTPEALVQKLDAVALRLRASSPTSQMAGSTSVASPSVRGGSSQADSRAASGDNRPASTPETLPRLDLFQSESVAGFSGQPRLSSNPPAGLPAAENKSHGAMVPGDSRGPSKVTTVSSGAVISSETDVSRTAPAFHGICIVTAQEDREIVKGASRYQLIYKDKRLCFQTEAHKARFAADPERYWPMLDGLCAATLAEEGRRTEGEFQFAAAFRKRVWLFASEELMQQFLKEPSEITEEALEQLEEQPVTPVP